MHFRLKAAADLFADIARVRSPDRLLRDDRIPPPLPPSTDRPQCQRKHSCDPDDTSNDAARDRASVRARMRGACETDRRAETGHDVALPRLHEALICGYLELYASAVT